MEERKRGMERGEEGGEKGREREREREKEVETCFVLLFICMEMPRLSQVVTSGPDFWQGKSASIK